MATQTPAQRRAAASKAAATRKRSSAKQSAAATQRLDELGQRASLVVREFDRLKRRGARAFRKRV